MARKDWTFRKVKIPPMTMPMIEKRIEDYTGQVRLFWSSAKQGYYADIKLVGVEEDIFAKVASVPGRFRVGVNAETWSVKEMIHFPFSVWFEEFPAGDEVFLECFSKVQYFHMEFGVGPSQPDALELLGHEDEEVRAYALAHIAEWRERWEDMGKP